MPYSRWQRPGPQRPGLGPGHPSPPLGPLPITLNPNVSPPLWQDVAEFPDSTPREFLAQPVSTVEEPLPEQTQTRGWAHFPDAVVRPALVAALLLFATSVPPAPEEPLVSAVHVSCPDAARLPLSSPPSFFTEAGAIERTSALAAAEFPAAVKRLSPLPGYEVGDEAVERTASLAATSFPDLVRAAPPPFQLFESFIYPIVAVVLPTVPLVSFPDVVERVTSQTLVPPFVSLERTTPLAATAFPDATRLPLSALAIFALPPKPEETIAESFQPRFIDTAPRVVLLQTGTEAAPEAPERTAPLAATAFPDSLRLAPTTTPWFVEPPTPEETLSEPLQPRYPDAAPLVRLAPQSYFASDEVVERTSPLAWSFFPDSAERLPQPQGWVTTATKGEETIEEAFFPHHPDELPLLRLQPGEFLFFASVEAPERTTPLVAAAFFDTVQRLQPQGLSTTSEPPVPERTSPFAATAFPDTTKLLQPPSRAPFFSSVETPERTSPLASSWSDPAQRLSPLPGWSTPATKAEETIPEAFQPRFPDTAPLTRTPLAEVFFYSGEVEPGPLPIFWAVFPDSLKLARATDGFFVTVLPLAPPVAATAFPDRLPLLTAPEVGVAPLLVAEIDWSTWYPDRIALLGVALQSYVAEMGPLPIPTPPVPPVPPVPPTPPQNFGGGSGGGFGGGFSAGVSGGLRPVLLPTQHEKEEEEEEGAAGLALWKRKPDAEEGEPIDVVAEVVEPGEKPPKIVFVFVPVSAPPLPQLPVRTGPPTWLLVTGAVVAVGLVAYFVGRAAAPPARQRRSGTRRRSRSRS